MVISPMKMVTVSKKIVTMVTELTGGKHRQLTKLRLQQATAALPLPYSQLFAQALYHTLALR